jgi:hypothetical protein
MPCFYVTSNKDDYKQIPELQVCLADRAEKRTWHIQVVNRGGAR